MLTCPLCQTVQPPALECQVCGRDLRPLLGRQAVPPAAAPEPLPGLELTSLAVDAPGPAAPLPDLLPTRLAPEGTAGLAQPLTELVATAFSPAPQAGLAPAPLAELEATRAAPVGGPTPVAEGPVTCRYCRNVQAEGLFCERCGMRLARAQLGVVVGRELAQAGRCRACGAPGVQGQRCGECGAPVPLA